jgi:hypothetical protein
MRERRGANAVRAHVSKCKIEELPRENVMIKLVAAGLVLAVVSSAHAMPLAPAPQQDTSVIPVREACGAGFTRVNGVCVRTPARAAVRRGAVRR